MALENIIKCCDKELDFKLMEGQPWQTYIPETAICLNCNTYYERKPGNNFAYKASKNCESYSCSVDGAEILAEKVAHPIWDGSFPCSGSGQCEYEKVPYCPKHEKKPNFDGQPIRIPFPGRLV